MREREEKKKVAAKKQEEAAKKLAAENSKKDAVGLNTDVIVTSEEDITTPVIAEVLEFNINQLEQSSEFLQIQELNEEFVDSMAADLSTNPNPMACQVLSVLIT